MDGWIPTNANNGLLIKNCPYWQSCFLFGKERKTRWPVLKIIENIHQGFFFAFTFHHTSTFHYSASTLLLFSRPVCEKRLGGWDAGAHFPNCFNKPPKGRLHSDLSQWRECSAVSCFEIENIWFGLAILFKVNLEEISGQNNQESWFKTLALKYPYSISILLRNSHSVSD